jgi:bifunctional non-homologous end joining protein LigD
VLYPRDGICKRDIAGYYRDVAPLIVPHLMDRPIVVQRWPDGIDEFDWYQHRMPPRAPDYLRASWIEGVRRILIENADALLWMVNQAGLTYHVFASRLSNLTSPDYAMIDLDPGDRTSWWDETIEVALAVRILEASSAERGQDERPARHHILVPLEPGTRSSRPRLPGGVASCCSPVPDKVVDFRREKRGGCSSP